MYDPELRARFEHYQRFVALEILEHIEGDLDLVEALSSGALVVFSVPTYDSAAHVRHFKTPDEAAERYGGLLDLDASHAAVLPLASKPHKKIFVMAGRRF